MAEVDWAPLRTEAEARVAERFLHRRGLTPPVPVEDLVREFADVETAQFPGDWDALLLQVRDERPQVILSADGASNPRRRRFTLAHELGHLLIPWSLGTAFCHADGSSRISDELIGTLEAEANRFAAELLVPRRWLLTRIDHTSNISARDFADIAVEADVSPPVAILASAAALPPGSMLLLVGKDGLVQYSAVATETYVRCPQSGDNFDERNLTSGDTQTTKYKVGQSEIVLIRHPISVTCHVTGHYAKPSEILDAILARSAEPLDKRPRIKQRIFGIIGSANVIDKTLADEKALCSLLHQRFTGRPFLTQLMADELWKEFVAMAARDLARKRTIK